MYIVAWHNKAEGSHRIVNLSSSQGKADTKLMLHAVEATNNGASSLKIFFPDTGVLVLSVRRYPNLAADTSMATGIRVIHRNIKLRPRYNALWPRKCSSTSWVACLVESRYYWGVCRQRQ